MPIELNIYDLKTASTIRLNSASTSDKSVLVRYKPTPAERDEMGNLQPVSEQVIVNYTTPAAARAALTAINKAFQAAAIKARSEARHPGVFAQYRPDTSETLYRSEIIKGRAWISRTKLPMQMTIEWTHVYFWERDAEISTTYSDGTTSTKRITNVPGSNVISLQASAIQGDIEAPVRIDRVHVGTVSGKIYAAHVGAILGTQSSWSGLLEAESGNYTNITSPGSTVANANSSGGNYRTMPISSVGSLAIPDDPGFCMRMVWTLTGAQLVMLNGRQVRPIVRVTDQPAADVQFCFAVGATAAGNNPGLTDVILFRTDWQSARGDARGIVIGNALPIPPRPIVLAAGESFSTLNFSLWARRINTGGGTINVDYVQLVPADGWRSYKTGIVDGWGTGDVLRESQDLRNAYIWNANVVKTQFENIISPPIMIAPGEAASFYFQIETSGISPGITSIAAQEDIDIRYRPRRLTI